MRWLLQVLIGQRMGQDWRKKCCCPIHVQITYDCECFFFLILCCCFFLFFFTEMAPQPTVSGWHAQLPTVMLFAANMAAMCARAERSTTHHVSAPILAPVRARMNDSSMCACVLSSLSSLLPDSVNSNSTPPDVLLCSPTPWCYISHVVLDRVRCQASVSVAVSYSRRHVVTLCLYSQLALKDLWLNNDAEKCAMMYWFVYFAYKLFLFARTSS